jgi:hypothetical protein
MIDITEHKTVALTLYVLLTRFTDTSNGRVSIFPYDSNSYIINLNLASEIMKSIFLCWKIRRKTLHAEFRRLFNSPSNVSVRDMVCYTGVRDKIDYYLLIPKDWLNEFILFVRPQLFENIVRSMNFSLYLQSRLQYEYLNRSLSVTRIRDRSKRFVVDSTNSVVLGESWSEKLLLQRFGSPGHRYGFFGLEPFEIPNAHTDLHRNYWYQSDGNDTFRALMIAKFLIYDALDRPHLRRGRKRKADNIDSHDDLVIKKFIESDDIQRYTLDEAVKILETQLHGYVAIDCNLINAKFQ